MEISKIIEQFNLGDKAALNQIYERMNKTIFWLGYMITDNYDNAESILENTMIELSKRAYKYNAKKNGEVWILSIAKEKAFDEKLSANQYNSKEYIDIINDNEETLEVGFVNELKELDIKEKQILVLKNYARISEVAIAKVMGLKSSEVREIADKVGQKNDIIEKINSIALNLDGNIMEKCQEPKTKEYKKEKTKSYAKRWALKILGGLAAIFIIILIVNNNKYRKALELFKENDFDRTNYTKNEIVEIYKDIKNETFSNKLTEEIIENELSERSIEGEVIAKAKDATAQEKWELLSANKYIEKKYEKADVEQIEGISYIEEFTADGMNTIVEYNVPDSSFWSVKLEGVYLGVYGKTVKWGDYYVVCGESDYVNNSNPIETYVALINNSGELLWKVKVDMGAEATGFADIIVKEDKIIIVTNCNENQIGFAELDVDGNLTVCGITPEIINKEIVNTAMINENYYCFVEYSFGYSTEMLSIPNNFQTLEGRQLDHKDKVEMIISNMVEYNGEIYLSGYEIEGSAESTKEGRNVYRAVLWKMELKEKGHLGSIEEVYSVDGATQSELVINKEGKVVWDVKYIEDYKPYNSAHNIGKYRTYRYIFDENMDIMYKIKTDRIEEFLD